MKKNLLLLSSLCLALTACQDNRTAPGQNPNRPGAPGSGGPSTSYQSGYGADSAARPGYAADNTGRNVRDRGNTMTPENQSENEADRTITQRIRQALMEDDSLSNNAKNIKVITVREVVTLRGTVNNDRERNAVAQKAKSVSGVRNVDNQLEVAGNR